MFQQEMPAADIGTWLRSKAVGVYTGLASQCIYLQTGIIRNCHQSARFSESYGFFGCIFSIGASILFNYHQESKFIRGDEI